MPSNGAWTDARVERLKKLWGEGLSASQIAGRLGGVTRNAVISKVHRLGLSGRTTTQPRTRITSKKPRKAQPPKPPPQPPESALEPDLPPERVEIVVPEAERVGVAGVKRDQCRWPIGDPLQPGFHFCHHTKTPGSSYCPYHMRKATQPVTPRSRRGPSKAKQSQLEEA